MTIEIQHNSAAILDAFNQLLERSQEMEPVMRALSGVMTGAVEDAFEQQKAPDGTPWATLSEDTTIPRRKAKNHWPKHGAGQILQDSGQLAASVHSEYGDDYATVGTNKPYAAMMHFGGKKADFPHLWGDIPARPFLGLSADDEDEIIDILQDFLTLSS